MKKENADFLRKYADGMITARYYNYTSLDRPILQEMDRIYTDETGEDLHTNLDCDACNVMLACRCARMYFTEFPDEMPENTEALMEHYAKIYREHHGE